MDAFVRSLLGGPIRRAERDHAPGGRPVLALPLLLLCSLFAGAAAGGVASFSRAQLVGLALNTLPLAAGATLLCLILALPVVAAPGRLPWLLPLWLASAAGTAGWALFPVADGPILHMLETAGLLLPVMVLALAGGWDRIPRGLLQSGATSGAPPATIFRRVILELALPGLARACLLVLVLGVGVIESLQTPLK